MNAYDTRSGVQFNGVVGLTVAQRVSHLLLMRRGVLNLQGDSKSTAYHANGKI